MLIDSLDDNRNQKKQVVLLTIDLTLPVLRAAIKEHANNLKHIIAYHPVIFKPIIRLSREEDKGELYLTLLRAGISVYSPHTAVDAVGPHGLNDWILKPFSPYKNIEPIQRIKRTTQITSVQPDDNDLSCGYGRVAELEKSISIREVCNRYKKHFNIPHCKQTIKLIGRALLARSLKTVQTWEILK